MHALEPNLLPTELQKMLLGTFVRFQLWRRAQGISKEARLELSMTILQDDVEVLLEGASSWYLPLMKHRRRTSFPHTHTHTRTQESVVMEIRLRTFVPSLLSGPGFRQMLSL